MKAKRKTSRRPSPPRAPWHGDLTRLTAADVMETNVVTVSHADPLSEVERVLSQQRISGAPVVDETGAVKGVVSLRDLVERYAEDPDARPRRGSGFFHLSSEETLDEDFDSFEVPAEAEETAADVMTSEVYWVPVGATVPRIARVMGRHGVHRLLVRDGRRFVGLVGTLELLEVLAGMDGRR
jgi:CBS domain-containing protein